MKFINTTSETINFVNYSVGPGQVIDVLDTSDAEVAEEILILTQSGELQFYQDPATPNLPAAASVVTGKRVWEHQIHGGRSYNYYSTSIDRSFNTVYGPALYYWSSGISKTNPTRVAHGISVPVKAKLKRVTHRFRSSTSASTPVVVKLWKQKKTHNSNAVTNTLLHTIVHTTASTSNQVLVWNADSMGDPVLEVDEVVFPAYSRETSGSNTFWYYENMVFEFESDE